MADKMLREQKEIGKRMSNFTANTEKLGEAALTLDVIQSRLALLERYWNETLDRHLQLLEHETEKVDDAYFANDLFSTYESAYTVAKSKLRTRIAAHVEQAQAEGLQDAAIRDAPIQVQSTAASLPKLKLPTFSGKQEEWDTFKEIFSSMVKDTNSLTPVLKLQHLLSCLEGEAARRLANFEVIGSNFDVAWTALCRRYDNKRLRQAVQMLKLLDMPAVTHRTPSEFTRLLDTTGQCLRALKQLQRPTEHWDDWFVHIVVFKLDQQTREDWEKSLEGSEDYPTFETLSSFLENRVKSLDNAHCHSPATDNLHHKSAPKVKAAAKERPRSLAAHHTTANLAAAAAPASATTSPRDRRPRDPCIVCKGAHFISQCPTYLQSTPTRKEIVVEQMHLCRNCLSATHSTAACQSKYRCRTCRGPHHSSLHDSLPPGEFLPPGPRPQLAPANAPTQPNIQTFVARVGGPVILGTARVVLQSSTGLSHEARVLIDPASEGHMLTERIVQLLRLRKSVVQTDVNGVGGVASISSSMVTAAIRSKTNTKFVLSFSALVLPKLTSLLPSERVEQRSWPHLRELPLADPAFYEPAEVDGILGADIYSLIIEEGLRTGEPGTPVGQLTKLGWILTGPTSPPTQPLTRSISSFVITLPPPTSVSAELRRFWEIEEISSRPVLTPDEQYCEDHFARTHRRDSSGRYVLRLPFRDTTEADDNRHTAVSRIQQVERRLARDPELAAQYHHFMHEYEQLGHLETVPPDERDSHPRNYLSHHGVVQQKLRVVFDGSCGSPPLNDRLHIGPKRQLDIDTVILRWRLFKFVFTADIVKMYRQILIDRADIDWLRIVMRTSPEHALTDKRLLTVTYGTSCAPFQALRTLMQLAEDEGPELPLGADVLRKHMYVDDAYAGASTLEEACAVRDQFIAILHRAGMSLGKWAANDRSLLPFTELSSEEHIFDPEDTVSTLGLKWSPGTDHFCFAAKDPPTRDIITKRIVLSEIARLHDLFGLLAPVTVRAKILLQLLWLSGKDWDSPIPLSLQEQWIDYRRQLGDLRLLRIPRWCGSDGVLEWTIVGYSDASERAYAAAVYLVCHSSHGSISSNLVASKSRVAPIKSVSLPRLELCGAVILSRLMVHVIDALPQKPSRVLCKSDSEIVLAWLRKPPSTWHTFVANRVSTIIGLLPDVTWQHVRSADNPADLATRGITPRDLHQSVLWWHGPSNILDDAVARADADEFETTVERRNEVNVFAAVVVVHPLDVILGRFSSLTRMLRSLSYARRLLLNLRLPAASRPPIDLNAMEISHTLHVIILEVQRQHFQVELDRLHNGQMWMRGSRLRSLRPFIDEDGVMRVGGRLHYSQLSFDEKHPIILPSQSHLSELIIRFAHSSTLHGGPQLMLSYIVRRYWILSVKPRLKAMYRRCIRCIRFQAQPANQQMAPLPAIRITPGPTFETTGLDYAGPFAVRTSKGRGQKSYKGYVAIFVCMVTRAVHMEVVSDYSSRTFLLAYDRFTSRRGNPRILYSDNGTTFHGADSELKRMFTEASAFSQAVSEAIANDQTTWTYIPPRGPHFGGLWEAAVKSFKFHLRRVLGDATLTFEEFTTLLCRIESCLNSRPLSAISTDPADVAALTPGHFLIGRALRSPPSAPIMEPLAGIQRWRLVEAMQAHFWQRWRKEVLNQMQVRSRWFDECSVPAVGDLVLLTDDQQPALHWPLARVTQLHPGGDGLTRVLTLRTATSTLRRPLSRVILLPCNESAVKHHDALRQSSTRSSSDDATPVDPGTSSPGSSGVPAVSRTQEVTAGGEQVTPSASTPGSTAPPMAGGASTSVNDSRYQLRPRHR